LDAGWRKILRDYRLFCDGRPMMETHARQQSIVTMTIETSDRPGTIAPDTSVRQSSSLRSFQFHHFNSSCCGSGVRAA
jgi:hypothetical protein